MSKQNWSAEVQLNLWEILQEISLGDSSLFLFVFP